MKKSASLLLFIVSLSLLATSLLAQRKTSLSGLWLMTNAILDNGHAPREALVIVDSIAAIARTEHQSDELIKTAVYRLSILRKVEDKDPGYFLPYVDSLIKTAENPMETSLLDVLKARLLISIYQQDSWRINSRTVVQRKITHESKVAFWTGPDFKFKIHELYTKALIPAERLQKTPNKTYKALLSKGNTPLLRPTLYDLILHDAIDYYKSGYGYTGSSEAPYLLTDLNALQNAAQFSSHEFAKPDPSDSLSATWLLLNFYKQLVGFHLKGDNLDALADVDLERLTWAYSTLPNETVGKERKVAVYRKTLQGVIQQYKSTDNGLYAAYQLANTYAEAAQGYHAARDTAHRYDYTLALKEINRFQKQLDQSIEKAALSKDTNKLSRGAASLLNLKNRILRPNYRIQMESYNLPGEPMLALVRFTNIEKLYFRIIKMPVAMGDLDFTQSKWTRLTQKQAVKSFSQRLPATGDHQEHTVEIKLPALEKGAYILLSSSDPSFSLDKMLGAGSFNVSNLTFISHGKELFFVNRTSGLPISGVEVKFFNKVWKNSYSYVLAAVAKTDAQGRVTDIQKDSRSQSIWAAYKGDTLTSDRYSYHSYQQNNGKDKEGTKNINFYLDRSIYRPGQRVLFKAIATVIYPDERGRQLLTDDKTHKVYLYDANRQLLDSVSGKLNEFGALSGDFTLPTGQLAGSYFLEAEDNIGKQYFNVEEYKRPTYFVTIDTVKEAIALGDSVTIHGQAMAYSGYPITDAKVDIRVMRRVYFPYSWYRYLPSTSASSIAHATVKTDETGHFEFTFKTTRGEKAWGKFMPDYNFQIEATSTDQNGETRSVNSSVVLGSQPFHLGLSIPDGPISGELDTVKLLSQTAAGVFTPQKVTLKITKILAPTRLLRERSWEAPDLSVIDSVSFVHDFPHDPYMDEQDKEMWQRGHVVYNKQITTSATGKIGIDKKIEPGWYEIQAEAPGINGQIIKDRQYVYLYAAKNPILSPIYNWSDFGKRLVLVNEKSGITLASSTDNQYVIYSITKMDKGELETDYKHLSIGRQPSLIPLSLTSKDYKGAKLDYIFVRDNRKYTGSMTCQLKDTTTKPVIVYESFRDKTEPGSKEHWTLHINKGSHRLKDMELLSAMYDASLDQFTHHDWSSLPRYIAGGIYSPRWSENSGFGIMNFRANAVSQHDYYYQNNYDKFIYAKLLKGGSYLRGRNLNIRGSRSGDELQGRVAGMAVTNSQEVKAIGYRADKVESLTAVVKTVDESKEQTPEKPSPQPQLQSVRSNFNETAFFYPTVHSDEKGNYSIDFQMPDALTTWKWMNLAYNKDLEMVTGVKEIVSQKTLMVSPNLPRFVRNGDRWTLSAKVINLSEEDLKCAVTLSIQDPATGITLNWVRNSDSSSKAISVKSKGNAPVRFQIVVPEDFTGPVNITVKVNSGNYSDGEKNLLPVLTNKMLVTESLPIYLKADGKQTFTMDKLLSFSDKAGTDKENKNLVFELTTNPIWNVVMALPDITLGDKPSGMDVLNKLYADVMGAYVIGTYPKIGEVIKQWSLDTSSAENALSSALEKNPELKSVLLKQTPWVMDATSEAAGHKALVRFFNRRALDSNQQALVKRLLTLQQSDGGFSWFTGGNSDVMSTQKILTGIYQLMRGKLKDPSLAIPLSTIADGAERFISAQHNMQYEQWKNNLEQRAIYNKNDTLYPMGASEIQYLYMLSLNREVKIKLNEMQGFFLQQEKIGWQDRSVYLQLMIAATQYRMGDKDFAINTLMTSLMDRAVRSEALGMYWKREVRFYGWYENNLQAQALAISLLMEMDQDAAHPEWRTFINELQRFLISQKQVNRWPATKTTIDACMAMIDAAPDDLAQERDISIKLGRKTLDLKKQIGTGYMRYKVKGEDINSSMGKVSVSVKSTSGNGQIPVYGALYWQYISPINAVETAAQTPGIKLGKSLYREINTAGGKQLIPVQASDILHIGDKLVSRLTINLDRDMSYVHLREMRPAGVQPDQTVSRYQFSDGLAYYQATGDLATDLYFDHINKGSYVIEYPVHVSHAGSFAAGTATMESFYAPEFSTHTEGISIQAEQ